MMDQRERERLRKSLEERYLRSLEIIVALSLLGTKSAREGSVSRYVEILRLLIASRYCYAQLCVKAIMMISISDERRRKKKILRSSNRPFAENGILFVMTINRD